MNPYRNPSANRSSWNPPETLDLGNPVHLHLHLHLATTPTPSPTPHQHLTPASAQHLQSGRAIFEPNVTVTALAGAEL